MNKIYVFASLIIFLIVCVLYAFYLQESNHQYELAKIRALEYKYEMKNRELERLRSKTQACPVPNLKNPRSCYFGSNYTCSWNDRIGRCDLIQ